jgi:Dam-replacing HTH domain/PLD-like domain
MSDFELVTTPTAQWLEKHLPKCRERFWVASPYITEFLPEVCKSLSAASRIMLTDASIRNYIDRSSSLAALEQLNNDGFQLRTLPRLHAKAYVIDGTSALVTSANATHGGMLRNYECGIAVYNPRLVEQVADSITDGFGAKNKPRKLTADSLQALRDVLAAAPYIPRLRLTGLSPIPTEPLDEPVVIKSATLKKAGQKSGWVPLTLQALFDAEQAGRFSDERSFSTQELYEFGLPLAAKRYPLNNTPQDKLRQQIQILRDLGLVRFLGRGRYQLLAKAE